MGEGRKHIEVNWVQGIAAALAAVTSAVLLSTVGVVGTLIGAALGSIVSTLGSAVYSYYIATTKDRVAARAAAAARVGQARTEVRQASEHLHRGTPGAADELTHAGQDLGQARTMLQEVEEKPPGGGWRAFLGALPWKWIALSATAVFVMAMTAILAFELVSGRAISSYTGGSDSDRRTTIPGLGGDRGDEPRQTPPPTPSAEASEGSSERPTEEPTATPSVTEEPGVAPFGEEPSDTATPTPTPTPTATPTTRSVPSAPATPAPSP